ncbi:MAG: chemotaxis protein CheR [Leptolyngbyaceae cyanobacterium RU_5_1]|nr:chemotaxis protein CheR [Leptolyngbyaceae cyanobacterium RU_5_1]
MASTPTSDTQTSQEPRLNQWLKQFFIRLIAEQTGLEIKPHDQEALDQKILFRTHVLQLCCPENYYQLLESQTIESRQEWQNLIALLTNSESFFFRDQGQFNLLKDHIFPELIQQKQTTKTLRICSAGCSTGEEPYSLAILLKQLIPDLDQWDLLILGIDINSVSLEKAKAGIYRPWSFRKVDPETKQQYFQRIKEMYHIHPDIKQMLRFQTVNLVNDEFPRLHSELREMDLIICRNVFIYFETAAITRVLEKFYHTLQPLGYLLTGHAELYGQDAQKFETKVFSDAIIYQRPAVAPSLLSALEAQRTPSESNCKNLDASPKSEGKIIETDIQLCENTPVRSSQRPDSKAFHTAVRNQNTSALLTEKELLRRAEMLARKKAYNLAIQQIEKVFELNSKNSYSHYLMAQIYNYLNDYEQSICYCQKALAIDVFFISPYYLMAEIYEKQGDLAVAKQMLKKIIYLELVLLRLT